MTVWTAVFRLAASGVLTDLPFWSTTSTLVESRHTLTVYSVAVAPGVVEAETIDVLPTWCSPRPKPCISTLDHV